MRPDDTTDSDVLRRLSSRLGDGIPLDEIHDWNQRQRDHWVEERARSVRSGLKVLDVGAGTCPYRKHFSDCIYHAHDFKRYEGNQYLKREKEVGSDGYGQIDFVSDIVELPVASSTYDVVLCTEVFEHIPEPILALQEISRVLKPGGRLFLTAPLGSGLHQLPFHFYGGFTPEWYRRFCGEMGLGLVSIEALGGYFKMMSQESARFAWTMDQHRDLHGADADALAHLFGNTLARYFYSLESERKLENFTAGYLVEARKLDSLTDLQNLIDLDPASSRLFISAARLALDLERFDEAGHYIEDLRELDGDTKMCRRLFSELGKRRLMVS